MRTLQWKTVQGFPDYEISNTGLVRSHRSKRARATAEGILMSLASTTPDGYQRVSLTNDDGYKPIHIHKLVALHFVSNPKHYPQINHIDGVKTNNNAYNLEWCSAKQNIRHSYAHNLVPSHKGVPRVKLNPLSVADIRLRLSKGDRHSAIAKDYGVARFTITLINTNRTWIGV